MFLLFDFLIGIRRISVNIYLTVNEWYIELAWSSRRLFQEEPRPCLSVHNQNLIARKCVKLSDISFWH